MKRQPFNLPAHLWVACVLVTAGWIGWEMAPEPARAIPAVSGEGLAMPLCSGRNRVTCIVDGDTIWVRGEKIRLEGFNTPEMKGQCKRESDLAKQAQRRLRELLDGVPFSISRSGTDRFGRTLATIRTAEGDVGKVLIREGLAHVWRGRQENWC